MAAYSSDSGSGDQMLGEVAQLTHLTKQALSGVGDVSLTLIHDGHPRSLAFTGPLALELDERQYELGSGPCLDAARTGRTLVVDPALDDTPYPEFAQIVGRAGVRQVISVGLPLAERTIGGLNIYKTAEGPVTHSFLEQAQAIARYAAVVVSLAGRYVAAAEEAAHLRTAMQSRAGIEQAKGILMARDGCTADEAFDVLRSISQHRNVKLRDVARSVTNSVQT